MKTTIAVMICILPVLANAQGQPSLVSVVFNPATVIGGASSTATITISAPARQNGFDVTLSLNSTVAQLKSSTITIAEGQSSQTVSVTTSPVAAQQIVILSTSTRSETRSGAITIVPAVTIATFQFPNELVSGLTATRQITLSAPAPEGGKIIQLSTTGADILRSAGAAVADTIAAGNKTKMKFSTAPVTDTDRPFEITATLDGISTRRTGTLRATTISSVSVPDSLVAGTLGTLKVTLRGVPPNGLFPVVIKSENESAIPSLGGVSATINAGTMSFQIYGNSVSSRTPVTLSVEHDGDVKRVSTTVIPRAAPVLTGFTVAPTSVRGGQSVTITATISNPAPQGGTVVHLAEFPGLAGFDVPTTLLIPQFATSKAITVAAPRSALPLSTDVKASLDIVFLNRTRFSVRVTINP